LRTDKSTSNALKVAQNIWSTIQNPVSIDDILSQVSAPKSNLGKRMAGPTKNDPNKRPKM